MATASTSEFNSLYLALSSAAIIVQDAGDKTKVDSLDRGAALLDALVIVEYAENRLRDLLEHGQLSSALPIRHVSERVNALLRKTRKLTLPAVSRTTSGQYQNRRRDGTFGSAKTPNPSQPSLGL